MQGLSISRAWEETRALLARDGKLIWTVALALVVLPAAILGAVTPGGLGTAILAIAESKSVGLLGLFVVVVLVILTGQLAITRLALGPSISVAGAIRNAGGRLLTYVAVSLIAGVVLFVILIIAAAILGATVAPGLTEQQIAQSPAVLFVVLVLSAAYFFLLARVVGLAAAVTTAEVRGPIATIRRAWSLTSGHTWRLLGFFVVFIIGTGIAVFAVTTATASVLQLLFGVIEPMSASALIAAVVDAMASGAVTVLLAVMLARIYAQLSGRGAQPSVPSSGV
jgi:hypothetical protein